MSFLLPATLTASARSFHQTRVTPVKSVGCADLYQRAAGSGPSLPPTSYAKGKDGKKHLWDPLYDLGKPWKSLQEDFVLRCHCWHSTGRVCPDRGPCLLGSV